MPVGTKIEVVSDTVTPWLARVRERCSPQRIAAAIGPGCTRLVQRNFRSLGQNKRGWPSTGFYGRAAEATNWQAQPDGLTVTVSQIGIRQRLLGGLIKPVNVKNLAIPAGPEAYGKVPGDFSDLKFGFALDPESGKMRPALVEKKGTEHKTKSGKVTSQATGLVALFWLCKKANQKPDPAVMPSDDAFAEVFDQSVEALIGK